MSPVLSPSLLEERKSAILEAAYQCFRKNGFFHTSVDDVVKEAGASKGAIYNYFNSKDELFMMLIKKETEETFAQLDRELEGMDSCWDKIHHIFHLDLITDQREHRWAGTMHFEFWIYAQNYPDYKNVMDERYRKFFELMRDIVEEGKRRGEFSTDLGTDVLATIFWSMIDGLRILYVGGGDEELLRRCSNVEEQFLYDVLHKQ